jgi:hypothetical protein
MLQPAVLQGLAVTHSARVSWLWLLLVAMPGSGWHLHPAATQEWDAGSKAASQACAWCSEQGPLHQCARRQQGWVPGREEGFSRGEAAAHDHRGREGQDLHACREQLRRTWAGVSAVQLGCSQLCWTLLVSVHSFSAACRAVAVGRHIHSWAGCAR